VGVGAYGFAPSFQPSACPTSTVLASGSRKKMAGRPDWLLVNGIPAASSAASSGAISSIPTQLHAASRAPYRAELLGGTPTLTSPHRLVQFGMYNNSQQPPAAPTSPPIRGSGQPRRGERQAGTREVYVCGAHVSVAATVLGARGELRGVRVGQLHEVNHIVACARRVGVPRLLGSFVVPAGARPVPVSDLGLNRQISDSSSAGTGHNRQNNCFPSALEVCGRGWRERHTYSKAPSPVPGVESAARDGHL
jgi:hypothetical protein